MRVKTAKRKIKSKAEAVPQPKRMTKDQRLKELVAFVQLCFVLYDETTFQRIADRTGLSVSTIQRLAAGHVSLACHFGTIQAFGMAAGVRLVAHEQGFTMSLVD